MKRTISGTLGMRELALLHGPRTREETRAAVVELIGRGLTDHDVAGALGLDVQLVRRFVASRQEGSP